MKRLASPKPPPSGDGVVRVDLPGRDPIWFRAPVDPVHCAALLQGVEAVKGYGPQRAAVCAILGYCWVPVTEQPETERPDLDTTEPRHLAMLYGAAVLRELLAGERPWSFAEVNFTAREVLDVLNVRIQVMRREADDLQAMQEAAREREGFTGAR